ncbi:MULTISPECIES: alpha/beta fold hydrolase [unclassified Variovorax]|uniref:alpha/beta fold hydrolase n=1 Tax=unclassified Variovorax TaxID=663243 RepID=UPI001BD6368A|nr:MULTISPECIES: alpha/beta hydrolase [unclassified Variovorax]
MNAVTRHLRVSLGESTVSSRIAYKLWGESSHPLVLCVHGLSRNSSDFDELAQALAGQYCVVCVDLPGRGQSDWLADASLYNSRTYLTVLEELVRHLAVRTVHWVGTSMGGLLGLQMAARHPQLVRSLVLNDVGAELDGAELQRLRDQAATPVEFRDLREAAVYFRATLGGFGQLDVARWEALAKSSVIADKQGGLRSRFDVRAVPLEPVTSRVYLWPVWNVVNCPVLILRGEHSRLLSREVCMRMQEEHADARWLEIPGTGHAPLFVDERTIGPIGMFLHRAMRLAHYQDALQG